MSDPDSQPKSAAKDLLGAVILAMAEFVLGLLSNRYSAQLPLVSIVIMGAIPLVLSLVWLYRKERAKGMLTKIFLEHPVSYSLIALVAICFFWNMGAIFLARVSHQPIRPSPPSPTEDGSHNINPGIALPSKPAEPTNKREHNRPKTPRFSQPQVASGEPPKAGNTKAIQDGLGNNQAVQNGTGNQQTTTGAGGLTQTMTNSPGGMQAGRDLTVNQYGAAMLMMTDAQQTAITEAMKPFKGKEIHLVCAPPEDDVAAYTASLAKSLAAAGMVVLGPESNPYAGCEQMYNGYLPEHPGMSFAIGPNYMLMANALATAMHQQVAADRDKIDWLQIIVRPNR